MYAMETKMHVTSKPRSSTLICAALSLVLNAIPSFAMTDAEVAVDVLHRELYISFVGRDKALVEKALADVYKDKLVPVKGTTNTYKLQKAQMKLATVLLSPRFVFGLAKPGDERLLEMTCDLKANDVAPVLERFKKEFGPAPLDEKDSNGTRLVAWHLEGGAMQLSIPSNGQARLKFFRPSIQNTIGMRVGTIVDKLLSTTNRTPGNASNAVINAARVKGAAPIKNTATANNKGANNKNVADDKLDTKAIAESVHITPSETRLLPAAPSGASQTRAESNATSAKRFIAQNKFGAAACRYDAAILDAPTSQTFFRELGRTESKLGQFRHAERHLGYAIACSPHDGLSWTYLAEAKFENHQGAAAKQLAHIAVAMDVLKGLKIDHYSPSCAPAFKAILDAELKAKDYK